MQRMRGDKTMMTKKEMIHTLQDKMAEFAKSDMFEMASMLFSYIEPKHIRTQIDIAVDEKEFEFMVYMNLLNYKCESESYDNQSTNIYDKKQLDFTIYGKEVIVTLSITTYQGDKYGLSFQAVKQFFYFCLAKIEKSMQEILAV